MKTRIFIPALFCVVLMACGAPATSLPATATVVVAPTVTLTASPTPVPFSGAMKAAQSPDMPNLEQAEFLSGSGGSGRNEIITRAGVPEETLVLYENAAKAWAAANEYGNVEISYLFDGNSWNMVLRDAATGNMLWSEDGQGALMTYPTIIRVDEQGIHADSDVKVRVLEGTKDSQDILVNGFVIVLRNPVSIGGKQYYSEWFNTTTGKWEQIAEVIARLPLGKEVTRDSFATITWESFPQIDANQVPLLEQKILAEPKLTSTAVDPVKFGENKSSEGISVVLNGTPENITPRFIAKQMTPEGEAHLVFWEAIVQGADGQNVRVVLITAHEPSLDEFKNAQLRYLRQIANAQNWITVTLIARSNESQTAFWKSALATPPDSANLAQWLIDNQGQGKFIIATLMNGI